MIYPVVVASHMSTIVVGQAHRGAELGRRSEDSVHRIYYDRRVVLHLIAASFTMRRAWLRGQYADEAFTSRNNTSSHSFRVRNGFIVSQSGRASVSWCEFLRRGRSRELRIVEGRQAVAHRASPRYQWPDHGL